MILQSISRSEVLRYMGHKGDVPPELEKILDKSEEIIKSHIFPKYVYRTADMDTEGDIVKIKGFPSEISSHDLAEHLKGCNRAVIMAVTLTSEADRIISRAEISDMMQAYALDAICSSAIETACDMAESEIFKEIDAKYTSWRYSAGYGDLNLSYQKDFIKFLNAEKRIGLTLTPEYMMIPRKSVTSITGISDTPIENKRKSCISCNMYGKCRFSRDGGHC